MPALAGATASAIAGAAVPAEAASPAAAASVPSQPEVTADGTGVPQQVADRLFAGLADGTANADDLAVPASIADPTGCQGPIAPIRDSGSAQANLDSLLWESGDSSWLDD